MSDVWLCEYKNVLGKRVVAKIIEQDETGIHVITPGTHMREVVTMHDDVRIFQGPDIEEAKIDMNYQLSKADLDVIIAGLFLLRKQASRLFKKWDAGLFNQQSPEIEVYKKIDAVEAKLGRSKSEKVSDIHKH